jgi:uncharacterized membrane protein
VYSTEDGRQAYDILAHYGVDLVVVSALERRTYPADGLSKFESNPDLFAKVYDADGGTVYATAFSKWFPRAAAQ